MIPIEGDSLTERTEKERAKESLAKTTIILGWFCACQRLTSEEQYQ